MASKDNRSRIADCLAVVTSLRVWACVALAACAYFALHWLSLRPRTIVVDPGAVGAIVRASLAAGVVESLQYAVPVLCLCLLLVAQAPAAITRPEGAETLPDV